MIRRVTKTSQRGRKAPDRTDLYSNRVQSRSPQARKRSMTRNPRIRPQAAPSERLEDADEAKLPLTSLLARNTRLVDLLPHLHQQAVEISGGSRSLLFEQNPRNGLMLATSGFGVDGLPSDPWTPGPGEAAVIDGTFARHEPL